MCDPAGVHITRIYVNNCSRQTPSPIRSTNTVPVCTSTPIINIPSSNLSPQQQQQQKQMALIAKEILASQRSSSSDTFTIKTESPKHNEYVFRSKETGQSIDFTTGDGIAKLINPNTGTTTKKKKNRQSLAVVPPPLSARSSKSSDDGDNLVPMTNDMKLSNEKPKTNFTSYDGIQMFTFTLDDD